MTITKISDHLNEIINEVDELEHVPEDKKSSLRSSIEDILDELDGISDEFGDEPRDDDPYGDNGDDEEE